MSYKDYQNNKLAIENRRKAYKANPAPEQDITDTIEEMKAQHTDKEWARMRITEGRVLTFDYEGSRTSLEIGRVEDGKYYAKEVQLFEQNTVASHYRHAVDQSKNPPYCWDCDRPVTEEATLEGKRKYQARVERRLADGTPIDDYDEEDDDDPELPLAV